MPSSKSQSIQHWDLDALTTKEMKEYFDSGRDCRETGTCAFQQGVNHQSVQKQSDSDLGKIEHRDQS